MNLTKYYPIESAAKLAEYLETYLPIVVFIAKMFGVNLRSPEMSGDHLGLQVLNNEEFDKADELIKGYARVVHDTVIHERRNRVYQFNDPMGVLDLTFQSIEIFESKPGADLRRLKAGIEHAAFRVDNFDAFFEKIKAVGVSVDKFADMNGSKFFKTTLVNLVEIEFRNDYLGI